MMITILLIAIFRALNALYIIEASVGDEFCMLLKHVTSESLFEISEGSSYNAPIKYRP